MATPGRIKSTVGGMVGTGPGDLVALDSLSRLPAVDGSLLTGISAGGGAVKTVGSGGDYATLAAAAAAGERAVMLISSVTETSDVTLSNDLVVFGSGNSLDIATYKFVLAGFDIVFSDTSIGFNRTVTGELFTSTLQCRVTLISSDVIAISSAQTVYARPFGANIAVTAISTVFIIANSTLSGIVLSTTEKSYFAGCWIAGGGTWCQEVITLAAGDFAAGLYVSGVWVNAALIVNKGAAIHGLYTDDVDVAITVKGTIDGIQMSNGWTRGITVDGGKLANGNVGSHAITITGATQSTGAVLSGIRVEGTITVDGTVVSCHISDCQSYAMTLSPLNGAHVVNHAAWNSTITVTSGDSTSLVGCSAGVGGTGTIVVNTGVTNTRIVGCSTRSAISDSGTGTVVAGNVVIP